MSFTKEFKEFATKGSVVDLAVGVIIGVAFQKTTADLGVLGCDLAKDYSFCNSERLQSKP